MAIYIGLKSIEEDEHTKMYSFFNCDGYEYGVLGIDKESKEIELLKKKDDKAEAFAYPRARRALEKEVKNGNLPDELSYSA